MQAIRTLRSAAHARAASPALDQFVEEPASQHKSISTNNTSNANSTHTYSTTFSRIQTFAKLRRPSPPTTPAPSPTPPPTVQDGSYLQTLGLKLSEATSRALAPVLGGGSDSLKGRRPLPPGRGRALGALISRSVIYYWLRSSSDQIWRRGTPFRPSGGSPFGRSRKHSRKRSIEPDELNKNNSYNE